MQGDAEETEHSLKSSPQKGQPCISQVFAEYSGCIIPAQVMNTPYIIRVVHCSIMVQSSELNTFLE
jgi:hypothetical protein